MKNELASIFCLLREGYSMSLGCQKHGKWHTSRQYPKGNQLPQNEQKSASGLHFPLPCCSDSWFLVGLREERMAGSTVPAPGLGLDTLTTSSTATASQSSQLPRSFINWLPAAIALGESNWMKVVRILNVGFLQKTTKGQQ